MCLVFEWPPLPQDHRQTVYQDSSSTLTLIDLLWGGRLDHWSDDPFEFDPPKRRWRCLIPILAVVTIPLFPWEIFLDHDCVFECCTKALPLLESKSSLKPLEEVTAWVLLSSSKRLTSLMPRFYQLRLLCRSVVSVTIYQGSGPKGFWALMLG